MTESGSGSKGNGGITPVTVGNPKSAASFIVDQSHLEDLANPDVSNSTIECDRPPRGIFFTVLSEEEKTLEKPRLSVSSGN